MRRTEESRLVLEFPAAVGLTAGAPMGFFSMPINDHVLLELAAGARHTRRKVPGCQRSIGFPDSTLRRHRWVRPRPGGAGGGALRGFAGFGLRRVVVADRRRRYGRGRWRWHQLCGTRRGALGASRRAGRCAASGHRRIVPDDVFLGLRLGRGRDQRETGGSKSGMQCSSHRRTPV